MLLNTFKALEPAKRQNLLILFITGLFFWTSTTCLLPTLPAYIQDLGATKQQVGLVMGCFAIGLLLSRTWLGWLADHHSRKIVVLIGTVVVGIAPLGYLLADSLPVLMGLRAFHGISIAAFTTGYSALVIDLSPVKQRGELIGYMSLVVPIGMALGPAVGGFLQAEAGYTVLFIVSAICGFMALILASLVKEKTRKKTLNLTDIPEPTRTFWQLMGNHALQVPALVLFLIGLLFGNLVTFLPLYVEDIQVELNVGLFYTAAAIASFSVRVFAGRASDTIGRGLLITGSLVCYIIAMILLAYAHTPRDFLLAALIEGTGGGILIPMILVLMSDRSYANERGKVSSICIGGFDLGIALAGPILGFLAEMFSYRGIFSLTAGFATLALLIFLTQSGKNLPHSLRFALGQEKDAYALD
ncbi:MAG: MFS transporter [Gomphosphaeria aponina SAG 52.96 = DSM 107014]|uniref:MFS transporter n=1 Tax=Gomphosphaeria aponina SAG 52.96 = DSM 107014 TaxID=1521640 RepID=A0A941GWB2_9CHRO|nr:MFS transporter [Gomphosphaeria aponina SAG 52.96 = DSM 107014]